MESDMWKYFVIHFHNGLAPAIVEEVLWTAIDEIAERAKLRVQDLTVQPEAQIGCFGIFHGEEQIATLVPHGWAPPF
jgi:hypothetical protein